jgi:hypothetical protein
LCLPQSQTCHGKQHVLNKPARSIQISQQCPIPPSTTATRSEKINALRQGLTQRARRAP